MSLSSWSHRAVVALFLSSLAVAGCECGESVPVGAGDLDGGRGGGDAAPPLTGLTSLRVEPEEATVRITGSTPAMQTFRAIATFEDGREEDVSERIGWSLEDPRLGAFSGPTFTSVVAHGGRSRVLARADDNVAEADLTVVMEQHVSIAPSGEGAAALPEDPRALFEGAPEDGERAPSLVYPNDGVVVPPNLGRMEIHWLRGSPENTLFDVAFTNAATDVHAYVRCERPEGVRDDGCIWEPSGAVWQYIAETNRGDAPLEVVVRATDDEGTGVGASDSRAMRFALDDLDGTIYYWTVSDGGRINRFDFGAESGMAESVLGPELTESGKCVGCHALSNDGRKLLGTVGGQQNGGMLLFDLETGEPLRNASAADDHVLQFGDFSPDGNELVGVYGDNTGKDAFGEDWGDLLLFDTRCDAGSMDTCGMRSGVIDLAGAEASHPDWSPDGQRIVYTDVGHHRTSQKPGHGEIAYVTRDGDGWSGPEVLVPRGDGVNRYTPFYAPTSDFVVFAESTCPGGDVASGDCNADTDPTSVLYAVDADGGDPILLGSAVSPGTLDEDDALANTFPRFAPFVFTLAVGDLGPNQVMWLTFSSTREYGLRSPVASGSGESDRGTYLWMTAVTPEALMRGEDPSWPAFALPFQELDTSNHIAVWTTEAVGDPDLFLY